MLATDDMKLAVASYDAGRFGQAEALCRQILLADPDNAEALNLLAVLACRAGRVDEGIEISLSVLGRDPSNLQALELLADALTTLEEYAGSAEALRRARALKPKDGRLIAKHGVALHQAGSLELAVTAYREAIAHGAVTSSLCLDLGTALAELERPLEAIAALECALVLDDRLARGWMILGAQLAALDRLPEAVEALSRAVAIEPANPELHYNLGRHLLELGRTDDGLAALDRALDLAPFFVEAHAALSAGLWQAGRFREAADAARSALALRPGHLTALTNLGNALSGLGAADEALAVYRQLLAADPRQPDAWVNQGLVLQSLGQLREAVASLEEAVRLDPERPRALFYLTLAQLRAGDFQRGWPGYGLRWRMWGAPDNPAFDPATAWTGGPLERGRLLVWGEQGIGDEVMFAGLLPRLSETGAEVTVECDSRLVPLFRRSFPGVVVVPRGGVDCAGSHVPAGDLPGILRPDQGQGPWLPPAYLRADTARAEGFRRKYGDARPLVGLAWHSANRATGGRRSLGDAQVQALLARRGVHWVSLQYGDAALPWAGALTVDAEVDQKADLDTFAAQVAAMDLVVTIDNSAAHMAGALGRPTLLLLPFDADWRWFDGREDSPWYPGLRLLRQPAPGDWAPVMRQVLELLPA